MDSERVLNRIRKCLALAADERGDPTERQTATRQAALLMEQLEAMATADIPSASDDAWAPYWATRTIADAMRAGITTRALTREGWYVPG